MISLFAFTLYLFPPDTNSTASATRGVFLSWDPALNNTLVASAPVSTTRFFLLAFGSKYPVSDEARVPDRGSTARAGVKKPVALPVSYQHLFSQSEYSHLSYYGVADCSGYSPDLSSYVRRGCSQLPQTPQSGRDSSYYS